MVNPAARDTTTSTGSRRPDSAPPPRTAYPTPRKPLRSTVSAFLPSMPARGHGAGTHIGTVAKRTSARRRTGQDTGGTSMRPCTPTRGARPRRGPVPPEVNVQCSPSHRPTAIRLTPGRRRQHRATSPTTALPPAIGDIAVRRRGPGLARRLATRSGRKPMPTPESALNGSDSPGTPHGSTRTRNRPCPYPERLVYLVLPARRCRRHVQHPRPAWLRGLLTGSLAVLGRHGPTVSPRPHDLHRLLAEAWRMPHR